MRPLLLSACLWLAIPARADFNALFDGLGIPPGWAEQQEAMRLFKLEQERKAKAKGSALRSAGDLFNPSRVPKQPADCVFEAVAAMMGVQPPAEDKRPPVWYGSRTLLEDYAEWIFADTQAWERPARIETRFLPRANAIFMDDDASYSSARTIDDALAGQAALFYQYQAGLDPRSHEASMRAHEIARRFNAEYTSKKRSACPPAR